MGPPGAAAPPAGGAYNGPELKTEHDFHALLDAVGIPRNSPVLVAETRDELLGAVGLIEAERHSLGAEAISSSNRVVMPFLAAAASTKS